MSSNVSLRTIRIPALRQQCRFQHRQPLQSPRAFSTTAPQAFASTSPRLRRKDSNTNRLMSKAAMTKTGQTSPEVLRDQAEHEGEGEMVEDIGLLQDTIVRASWRNLPGIWKRAFWGYWWKVLKNKGTGLYSRSMYKRCIYKKGIASYFPMDAFNNTQNVELAKTLYVQLYENFARRDAASISNFCLPPLASDFKSRIAARGALEMDWKLIKLHSARVVSHRAVAFGEDQPDSAIRQIIIRLASTQSLRVDRKGPAAMSASTASMRSSVGLSWIPDEAKKLRKDQARGNAPTREVEKVKTVEEPKEAKKEVVEYLVLQKRVLSGTEEKAWKVWGFAPESTPEQMEEDAAYWRKTLDAHAA